MSEHVDDQPEPGPQAGPEVGTEVGPEVDPQVDIDALVGDWLDWKGVSTALGVSVGKVRTLIRDHQLAAVVPVPGQGPKVPAALLDGGEIVKGVPGVLTVLEDGRFTDLEKLVWLFTPDETLPGRPIDAFRENRGSEAKRRAQAMAL